MKNKKSHLSCSEPFLLFILLSLFLWNLSCKMLQRGDVQIPPEVKREGTGIIPPPIQWEAVDLLAMAKGKILFKEEKMTFHALLRTSRSHKMRLEVFQPLGRMQFVYIYAPPWVSLFLPLRKVLYRGHSSSENLYKLFGFHMKGEEIMNLLTGIEQCHSIQHQGLFATALIKEQSIWQPSRSEKDIFLLLQNGGTLLLKDYQGDGMDDFQIISHYGQNRRRTDCFLIIPDQIEMILSDFPMKVIIEIADIRSYSLYADGSLICGYTKGTSSMNERNIFSDKPLESFLEIEIFDLDRMEVDRPLIIGDEHGDL